MGLIEMVGMAELQEMRGKQDKLLMCPKGESDGEVADRTHVTRARVYGQHEELKDELTHLVYP